MRAELDGLADLLESHFIYVEKRLVAVLNSMVRRLKALACTAPLHQLDARKTRLD